MTTFRQLASIDRDLETIEENLERYIAFRKAFLADRKPDQQAHPKNPEVHRREGALAAEAERAAHRVARADEERDDEGFSGVPERIYELIHDGCRLTPPNGGDRYENRIPNAEAALRMVGSLRMTISAALDAEVPA